MSYPIFHGIQLANNAHIKNFVVEKLAADPSVTEASRAWYNSTEKAWKATRLNTGGSVEVFTIAAKEDIDALNQARIDLLASTVAGEGSANIGFSGKVGTNGKYSTAAGTVQATLGAITQEIDTVKQDIADAASATTDAYSSTVIDNDGASLIGFEGQDGANGNITIAAGTVSDTLDLLVDSIDADRQNIKDNYLDKTTTTAQVVNAVETEFKGTVRFTGDIIQTGTTKIAVGEEVIFEDNIITLNSNVALTDTPTEDSGLAVNRGTEGTTNIVVWKESTKKLTAIKDATDKDNLVYDSIAFQGDLDALSLDVDTRLDILETKVGDNIGDPADLHTDNKTTLVAAINEEHDLNDLRASNLLSNAPGEGANKVGYQGVTGANSLFSIAAGTAKNTLDLISGAIDADRQARVVRTALISSLTSGEGSANVGFSGKAGANSKFSIAAGTVQASLESLVVEADSVRKSLEDDVAAGLNNLVTSINATKYKETSTVANTVHTIVHNLNSIEIDVNIWINHEGVWQNDLVGVSIIDANTVQIDLTENRNVKVMVERFDDISI